MRNHYQNISMFKLSTYLIITVCVHMCATNVRSTNDMCDILDICDILRSSYFLSGVSKSDSLDLGDIWSESPHIHASKLFFSGVPVSEVRSGCLLPMLLLLMMKSVADIMEICPRLDSKPVPTGRIYY